MIHNDREAEQLKGFIKQFEAFLAAPGPALTEDAIHNWDAPYIVRQYASLPDEIKAEALAAMRRHHRQGTDARDEANTLNERYGLI